MNPYQIAQAGGLFVIFAFNHFVVDWIFQTHYEAMNKTKNWKVRAFHCLVYTVGFIPLMWLLKFDGLTMGVSAAILFLSHFFEDTYIPVFLWAKYIRRIPDLNREKFISMFGQPLGFTLFIAVDQIIHLLFLWPLVYFALVGLPWVR